MIKEEIKNEPLYSVDLKKISLHLICGMFIGLGAVLPGISGGVLCVIFGIYRPIMNLLSNPKQTLKTQSHIIIPTIIGAAIGFLAVSKILGFLLDRYPDYSVCVFIGLIFGMIPSLFKEAGEKGKSKKDYIALAIAFVVILSILIGINLLSFEVEPNFGWFIFAGFCMALSIIIPGMSFSTFLMPLGLYTPLVTGIGDFDIGVLAPAAIGAVATVLLLSRAASWLMDTHYSTAFHSIIGIVIAATLVIIPFDSFTRSIESSLISVICVISAAIGSYMFSGLEVNKEA